MRRIDAHQSHTNAARRTLRVAAAAILSFFLGGAVVYETVKPVHQPAHVIKLAPVAAQPVTSPSDIHDAWQSEELQDFHNVVEWEAWVPENKTTPNQGSSL
jgi:hypothetical protein